MDESKLDIIISNVQADPHRKAEEKETSIHFLGDQDFAEIETYRPSIMRGLLKNSHFTPTSFVIINPETGSGRRIEPHKIELDQDIVGIVGQVPLGALKIMKSARKQNRAGDIVSY